MMKTKDEVMRLLHRMFPDKDKLNRWLDFPLPILGKITPRSVMEEDGGADAVFTIVDLMNWGGGF